MKGISNYKDAQAAHGVDDTVSYGPPKLTLVHNADVETAALEADTARLTSELRQLGHLIRAARQDLDALQMLRMQKADALQTSMRALAARVKHV